MGKVLTQAQKTFTDLYDSYVLNLSSDIVAVPCNQDGQSINNHEATITYNAVADSASVGVICTGIVEGTALEGVQYNISSEGKIIITVPKDLILPDDAETGFIFTTNNSSQFVFKKYITFIKIIQGTDGENARSFQIVSEQGDTFDEGVESITMTAMAFDGTTEIQGKSYAWDYFISGSGWTQILDNSNSTTDGAQATAYSRASLTVDKSSPYANSVFRCIITYDDDTNDVDYYQLKTAHHNYESVVKFFGGTSTIGGVNTSSASSDPFVIAYVDLYKDFQKEETVEADYYYYHENNIKTNSGIDIYTEGIDSTYNKDGNLIYAIYKDETVLPEDTSKFYTISASASPLEYGEVTGGGTYEYGSNIILTAAPKSGYVFDKWLDNNSTDATRNITVIQDASYTASFLVHESTSYTITAKANDPDHGSGYVNGKTGSQTCEAGSVVTLSASANVGYVFDDWYENGIAKHWPQSINITVTGDRTFNAYFRKVNATTTIDDIDVGESKNIYIYKNDKTYLQFQPITSGTYRFYCEDKSEMNAYLYNSDMRLLTTDTGYEFEIIYNFEENQIYYFAVDINEYEQNSNLVLVYLEDTDASGRYVVTLTMGAGGSSVAGAGLYEAGTIVPITATAKNGYEFVRWEDSHGNILATTRSYSLQVNYDINLTAIFQRIASSGDETSSYGINVSILPHEGCGTVSGAGIYEANTWVTLKATANDGYEFQGWYINKNNGGIEAVSSSSTYKFQATQTITYLAQFQDKHRKITVEWAGNGTVYMEGQFDGYGIEEGSNTKSGNFREGTAVRIVAVPDDNHQVSQWYLDGTLQNHTQRDFTISALQEHTLMVVFEPIAEDDEEQFYQINISVSPSDAGYIDGATTGSYKNGEIITCEAIANNGHVFSQWNDGTTTATRIITVSGNATYTAYFDPIDESDMFTVTTEIIPLGTGTVTGGGAYKSGQLCTVTATPNPGCTFLRWFKYLNGHTGNADEIIEGENPYTFPVTCDTTMMAVFDGTPSGGSGDTTQYTITVLSSDTTQGTVSGGGIFTSGDQVTITATPNEGYTFLWWNDDNRDATRTITVNDNQTYTAYFEVVREPVTITVKAIPSAWGTVSGGGTVEYGQTISIYAQANEGYQFSHWQEDGDWHNPRSITANYDETYTAVFTTKDPDIPTYTIETQVDPAGSGEAAGGGDYQQGGPCQVEAVPNGGYQFDHWEVSVPGVAGVKTITDNPYSFTVTGSAIYKACFSEYNLTVVVQADPVSGGTVTQSGTGSYGEGDVVKVTAKASDGYEFAGWYENGENKSNSATYQFAVLRNYTLVARFTAIDHEPSETEDRIIDGVLYVGTETTQINSPAYKNNSEIYSVVIPDSIVTPIGNSAFENCTYLQSITIGKNVTSIGSFAFQGCKRLTSIEIPNNVTSLDGYAFYQCTGLTQVTLGSGISIISNSAFRDCTSLQCVIMSKSVTSIKDIAFYQCNNLTDVYYEGTESDWAAISIGGSNNPLTKATIHYNYTTTYAASPMMMRSAAPMTLSLENNSVTTYAADDDTDRRARYKAALCQYTTGSGWSVLNETSNYIYHNDLYEDVKSNVIVVSKEDVPNYKSIGVTVYKKVIDNNNIVYDNDLIVSNTSFTVFDVNDPILSNKAPSGAKEGQLWLDTSEQPYILYIYQAGKWEYFNQQVGKTIYTTEPTTYTVGDIWILAKDQYGYGQGTMLTAIATVTVPGGFNIKHWTDANPNTTNVISSIVESFSRDDSGIKIAQKIEYTSGKVESPFYVHIDSQRMGFHSVIKEADDKTIDDEVVHIGIRSAEILNATFKGDHGTVFENDASFYNQVNILNEKSDGTQSGFAFQTEENGSFSLILVGN